MQNSKGNILVVDDEPEILELIEFHFANNWNVTTSVSPISALSLAKQYEYFLVITDIAMPKMDGYEFITELLNSGYKNEIAVMTGFGYNPKHTLVKINKKKKYPLFFKPLNFDKIQSVIQKIEEETKKDL